MDADYFARSVSSKHHHSGGSASVRDPDVSSSGSNSSQQKQKQKHCRVVPHEVIKIDGDRHRDSVSDYKNKQSMVHDVDRQKEVKGVHSNYLIGSSSSSSYPGVQNDILMNTEARTVQNDDEGVEASGPWLQCSKSKMPIDFDSRAQIEDEIDSTFKSFKQFDIVKDFSGHYFAHSSAPNMLSKNWIKAIQQEWKVLEKDLPEKIFVRAYEARIDLLRAVIIGSAGTPYHDGLFFFDIRFPFDYPQSPPSVHYHSYGLQLNPNLYDCGIVCISLLNTWSGRDCEMWKPSYSTMLQVLVSIQALVLNSKPYFNEPSHSSAANTHHGEGKSLAYNEQAFLLSCKAMLYSLRRPLKHFEDFVVGHFRKQGRAILVACKAYMRGAQVGSDIKGDEVQAVRKDYRPSTTKFKDNLRMLFEDLLKEFSVKGADCADFLDERKSKLKVLPDQRKSKLKLLSLKPLIPYRVFGLKFQH